MQGEELPVGTIPLTDELKGKIKAFIDAIVESFDGCRVDENVASSIDAAMRSIIGNIEPPNTGVENIIENIFFTMATGRAINDFINALEVVLKEIRGNKVLYENRQVIAAAIKDSSEKDGRSFIVFGGKSFVGDAVEMSAYTKNVQFIREYKKMLAKFKKGRKKSWSLKR